MPFFFHGDNGSVDGNRRSYTFIPPLLFYHSDHELDASRNTVVGPVIVQSDAKRSVFDIAPIFFHSVGKPETGGVIEEHTTLLPFYHWGRDPDGSLLVVPGYYRRVAKDYDTLLSLVYSRAETHGPDKHIKTEMTAAGPIIPLWWNYRDHDLGVHAWSVVPFFYTSDSPAGRDWLTPLVGHFETYARSNTTWIFPTITLGSDTHGWENDIHPIVYAGRHDDSSHTVIAPFFWDFASPTNRTTVGFPLYWRFAEGHDDSSCRWRRTRSTRRSASRAGPTGSSTSCRSFRTAKTRAGTSGTSCSASPATRITAPRRRRASSGSRSTGRPRRCRGRRRRQPSTGDS